jgi:hypothetical protein
MAGITSGGGGYDVNPAPIFPLGESEEYLHSSGAHGSEGGSIGEFFTIAIWVVVIIWAVLWIIEKVLEHYLPNDRDSD